MYLPNYVDPTKQPYYDSDGYLQYWCAQLRQMRACEHAACVSFRSYPTDGFVVFHGSQPRRPGLGLVAAAEPRDYFTSPSPVGEGASND